MNERKMRYGIGLFVLGALVFLGVLIWLFGAFPTRFQQHARYEVLFSDATGIAVGAPVRRQGVRVGEVEKVELDDQSGKVRVNLALDRKHPILTGDVPTLV